MSSSLPSLAPDHHDATDDSGTFVRVGRAKALPRPALKFSAVVFDRACAESGFSNGQIARALGTKEAFVRKLRSGERVPNLEHLALLPDEIKTSVARALKPANDPRDARIESALVVVLELVRARRGA